MGPEEEKVERRKKVEQINADAKNPVRGSQKGSGNAERRKSARKKKRLGGGGRSCRELIKNRESSPSCRSVQSKTWGGVQGRRGRTEERLGGGKRSVTGAWNTPGLAIREKCL